MEKVTKHLLSYPPGHAPDFILPKAYGSYRYALGKKGNNPLVVICMNPSAARGDSSDMTINRIIKVSQALNYDGWIVFNLYPERATDAKNIGKYKHAVSEKNISIIREFLADSNIREVWGAWGNTKGIDTLEVAKKELLDMLQKNGIRIFYFGTLTNEGNPRHPLQRNEKVVFAEECKKYF